MHGIIKSKKRVSKWSECGETEGRLIGFYCNESILFLNYYRFSV